MKSITIQFLLFFALIVNTFAQAEIRITEEVKPMSVGKQSAFVMEIPAATIKDVQKTWEKRMKEGTKEKVISEKDETFIQGSVIERISSEPMNIYARMFETREGVQLIAFFEDSSGFISRETNEAKASGILVVLNDFGLNIYKDVVEEELIEEEKLLSDLENDLAKLIKVTEKFYQDINENEREIGQIKDEINSNLADQERKNEAIENQKDQISGMKNASEEQVDQAQDLLKDLEKEKKKLVKENENLHKKIDKLESDIRQLERDIESNKEEEMLKKKEIDLQKEVIEVVRKRLQRIESGR